MSLFKKMKAQQTLKLNNKTVKLSADTFAQRNTKLKDTFDYWHEFSKLNKGIQPGLLQ